jgi:hypothetical protein
MGGVAARKAVAAALQAARMRTAKIRGGHPKRTGTRSIFRPPPLFLSRPLSVPICGGRRTKLLCLSPTLSRPLSVPIYGGRRTQNGRLATPWS